MNISNTSPAGGDQDANDMLEDETQLRRSLTALSMSLRKPREAPMPDVPRFVSYDTLRLADGRILGRKKVILMSGGCSVPTCTMCPFTNENNFKIGYNPKSLLDQVENVLIRSPDEPEYTVLALYNDGSFFAPREIPFSTQQLIAEKVAQVGVTRLVVESLPQFLTEETLRPFVRALNGVELEIGIGLQSADDLVRETLVNTRISRIVFEAALAAMRNCGVHSKIYLMIKPPFLTDAEAITDVVQSVNYVHSLGAEGVTLCPTRVARNTVAWRLWESGQYEPPNLWTVVDSVRRVHETTPVRVACINLRGSDFESVFPSSCPKCADQIVDGLMKYSETGDVDDLPTNCECRSRIEPVSLNHSRIVARSLQMLVDQRTMNAPP